MKENYRILIDDAENDEMLWHSGVEIAFVLNGYGVLFLDGEKYELQEEDIFVINSYQIHRIELKSGSHLLSLLVEWDFITRLFPDAEEYMYDCKSFMCSEQSKPSLEKLRMMLAGMINVWSKSQEEYSELYGNIKMAELLGFLFENFGIKKEKTDKKEEHWLDLIRYINESYQENITLQMLAKKEFMSQSYFSRMFQKEMGVTFTEYLTEIRLSHAVNLLSDKDKTVTDVCFETGFRNVNSFIESFKQKYKKTPGQFRKEIEEYEVCEKVFSPEEGVEFSALFEPLMKHINVSKTADNDDAGAEVKCVKVYCNHIKEHIKPVWKQLLNVGYAKDLLNVEVQQQVKRAGSEIGYRYVRFHGLLDDDMVLYQEKPDGTPILNYYYIDKVLDFVLEQNLYPYIEFGYMPKALAENPECSPFLRCSILSFPKYMEKWQMLIKSLMQHWISRYGNNELKKWIFSPLFAAEILFFYNGEQWERYMKWYRLTWKCIKEAGADYRIASPPCTAQDLDKVDEILRWCEEENCMPEILSLICFHTAGLNEEPDRNIHLIEREEAFSMAVSKDENYLAALKMELQPIVKKYGIETDKVILSEWNSNVWQRDLVNDTCYKAAFFFKNILENIHNYAAFGYWVLSDFMEEVSPAKELFHGGFGLFTTCGIPKSGYHALRLLNMMGNEMIAQGDGYMITKKEDEIQIFLYNYCHYETLYRYRHATNISRTNRYQVFCRKRKKQFRLQLLGMEPGIYQVMHYEINREHGSAYDEWVRMGAPLEVNSYERDYLEYKSYPKYHTETCKCEKELVLEEMMGEHEVALIRIKKHE